MEAEVEAGIGPRGVEIGVAVAAAGGSLLALCLWRAPLMRASARCRGGLGVGGPTSLHVDVGGDVAEGTDALEEAEKTLESGGAVA